MSTHPKTVSLDVTVRRGTAFDRVTQAVLLGHGRVLLNITRPDGTRMQLDCIDTDLDRAEYASWRNQ